MPDVRQPARRIFITTPGFESALAAELPPAFVAQSGEAPVGIVATSDPTGDDGEGNCEDEGDGKGAGAGAGAGIATIDPVFARQQLPRATEIHGPSVAALAEGAYARAETRVDHVTGPFTIHAFTPTGAAPSLGSRASLIGAAILELLRQRRRRAARWYRDPESLASTFGETRLLIQLLLAERDRAWVSAATPRALPGGGFSLAPWEGGVAPVADDRRPPSRAYRKLEEAFLWMNAAPRAGESCVDLGGAPGGWTYVALARGAHVTAVDRAPLDRSVLGHPRLTMIEGNAFTYEPASAGTPIDWLLSDIICEPARAAALIDRWLERGWCRRLVVTVKFKGRSGYGALAEIQAILQRRGCARMRIKHLHNNKNEVTVMADASIAPTVSPTASPIASPTLGAWIPPGRPRDPR